MTITVIYGPPASGKTRNSDRFLKHYQCARIVEEWDPAGRTSQRVHPRSGDLVLTQCGPETIRHYIGSPARAISIADALTAIGGEK